MSFSDHIQTFSVHLVYLVSHSLLFFKCMEALKWELASLWLFDFYLWFFKNYLDSLPNNILRNNHLLSSLSEILMQKLSSVNFLFPFIQMKVFCLSFMMYSIDNESRVVLRHGVIKMCEIQLLKYLQFSQHIQTWRMVWWYQQKENKIILDNEVPSIVRSCFHV